MRSMVLIFVLTVLGSGLGFGEAKTGAAAAAEVKAPNLAQMLTFAIQDEWAARAEYQAVLKVWPNAKPFANIVGAEENHIAWLKPLFSAHNVPMPAFATPAVVVPQDRTQALAVGAQAEVVNIAMYDRFLGQSLPDDVRSVFLELKKGSENHLRAFQK